MRKRKFHKSILRTYATVKFCNFANKSDAVCTKKIVTNQVCHCLLRYCINAFESNLLFSSRSISFYFDWYYKISYQSWSYIRNIFCVQFMANIIVGLSALLRFSLYTDISYLARWVVPHVYQEIFIWLIINTDKDFMQKRY